MASQPSQQQGSSNLAAVVLGKLTARSLAALVAFALLLISGILGIAVFRGSAVDLYFLKIGAGQEAPHTTAAPVLIRVNLEFEPEVNVRAPGVRVRAVMKAPDGSERQLPLIRQGTESGGMYVDAELPDTQTPIFLEIETPKGIWKTDDFSISKSRVRAFQLFQGQP